LARRNGNPGWPLNGERTSLTTPRICRELGRHTHNLKRQEWRHAFTGDAITFRHRLITEQHNGARPLIAIITERRLFILCAFAVAVSLRVWRTGNGREWNALTIGTMLPKVARDRLRRRRTPWESGGRNHRE
jgi:hypothetical protein